jgi:outer membrane protein OmpA-like peptidoglycan-associated protein
MFGLKTMMVVVLTGAMALTGCTNTDGTVNNTNTGVLGGAALGALVGSRVGNDSGRGAVVGALIGAAAGGAIGSQLDAQERALRADLGGSGAVITNTGSQLIVTLPEQITFDVDSAQLKSSFVGSLQRLASNIQSYPNTSIEVVGHTDSSGEAAYNQSLSERRAASVRSVLINSGVASSRVRAFGLGENQPVASNSTAAGRQANRRVEIYITPNQ